MGTLSDVDPKGAPHRQRLLVTIPKDEVERQGIVDGDLVTVEVHKVADTSQMSPEVHAAFERSWQTYATEYDYLKDH